VNLSGNQKLGALVAAILPLVASIYGQQAQRLEQNQARIAEQQARADAERQAADTADTASAQQLNDAFKHLANLPLGTGPSPELCSTLHTSLELLRRNAPTPKTEAVVTAWLTYRVEADGRRLVCDCKRTIRIAAANWLPQTEQTQLQSSASADGKSVHNDLIYALNAANTECIGTPPPTPLAAELSSPTPTGIPTERERKTPLERTATRSPGPQPPQEVAPPPPPPAPVAATPALPPPTPPFGLHRPAPGARIYFQVPDAETKDRIAAARSALEQAGYSVSDVQVMGATRSPRCAELRYIYANDTAEANTLLEDLNTSVMLAQLYGSTQPDQKQRRFSLKRMSRYEGRVLNRVYEVWLPNDGGRGCP